MYDLNRYQLLIYQVITFKVLLYHHLEVCSMQDLSILVVNNGVVVDAVNLRVDPPYRFCQCLQNRAEPLGGRT